MQPTTVLRNCLRCGSPFPTDAARDGIVVCRCGEAALVDPADLRSARGQSVQGADARDADLAGGATTRASASIGPGGANDPDPPAAAPTALRNPNTTAPRCTDGVGAAHWLGIIFLSSLIAIAVLSAVTWGYHRLLWLLR